jgi:hypothetical protein
MPATPEGVMLMQKLRSIPWTRKPGSFDDVDVVTLDALRAALEGSKLPVFLASDLWDEEQHPMEDFKRETPQHFFLYDGARRYVVDTQGYTYCRYMVRVVTDADVRDLSS